MMKTPHPVMVLALVSALGVIVACGPDAPPPITPPPQAQVADPWPDVTWGGSFFNLPGAMDADSERAVAVAASDVGFVAVGVAEGVGTVFGQIWFSTDGIEWERVEPADRFDGVAFLDVAAGPGGFVAVADLVAEPQRGEEPRIILYRSPDGQMWERAPDIRGASGGFAGGIGGGPGGYIVTGYRDPEPGPIVLVSADGVAWRLVTPAELGHASAGIRNPVAIDEGWLAVGGGEAAGMAVLASVDGITWSEFQIEPPGTNARVVERILVGPSSMVAFGGAGEPCGPFASCVGFGIGWWSADGSQWGRIADLDQGIPVGAATSDARGFVSLHGSEARWSPDGWHWLSLGEMGDDASAADVVTRGDRLVAVGEVMHEDESLRAYFHVGGPDIEVLE